MARNTSLENLLAEGASVPVEGWDFSWFAGRATEQRPSWGYAGLVAERMADAFAALDIQTGGGEVLATVPRAPMTLFATESWPPNVAIARRNLAALGGQVIEIDDDLPLPFADGSFDLVVSRHPTHTQWDEIARVLRPGGTYLSQQVGAGSNRELYEFLMGLQEPITGERVDRVRAQAHAAGLIPVDVRHEATRVEFYDVAAVVVFLRKVIWTVPDFAIERYRAALAELHEVIERRGVFVSHSHRILVEARRPA